MEKHAIILAALIGATAAQAQTSEPLYVTAAAGSTKLNEDCTSATSCDTSDTGAKLIGGYRFGNGFSLEIGYIDFGKFGASFGTYVETLKPTAVLMGGAFALPLNTDWGVNVRLGITHVKTKIRAVVGSASGTSSANKAKVYAGVGLTYAISKTFKLELGADSTEAEVLNEKGAVRLFSLGATYAF